MKRSLYTLLATLLIAGCGASEVDTTNSSSDAQDSAPQQESVSEPDAQDTVDSSDASTDSESSSATLPIDDFEIIPGEKFSFVTTATTRQDLAEQVGEAQLVDEDVHIGEGFMEPGTTVNLGDYSFKIVWADDSRTTPIEVRELGPAWELPDGIQLGMSFSELQETLGEFEIFGMGWDYAGTVLLDNTSLDAYREDLILRMEPAPGAAESHSDDFQAVLGDALFESTNPHLAPLDLTLEEVIVYLD
ncbi:MAG: hypothetical protein VKL39_05760 [Leptolyngbyaceae bacterium]|nr:hypothetical protein [Leptolyngbyaceae bacterium]